LSLALFELKLTRAGEVYPRVSGPCLAYLRPPGVQTSFDRFADRPRLARVSVLVGSQLRRELRLALERLEDHRLAVVERASEIWARQGGV